MEVEVEEEFLIHGVGNATTESSSLGIVNDFFIKPPTAGLGTGIIEAGEEESDLKCRSGADIISYQNYDDIKQLLIGPASVYSCVLHDDGGVRVWVGYRYTASKYRHCP